MRGLERGLERAFHHLEWLAPRPIAYVEIEAFASWNLVKQMEQGVLAPAPVWTNLKTFPYDQFHGKIHGFVGGYPCQPFSIAGKQRGTDDPRHLWPYIANGIRTTRPLWCFFENVRNHLNLGYETVRAELQEMGYEVREGIYSAEEVGAPHRRERLFILAIRKDVVHARLFRQEVGKEFSAGLEQSSELANTRHNDGSQRKPEVEQEKCTEKLSSSAELAHLFQSRLEESGKPSTWEKLQTIERSGGIVFQDRWPARPGQSQYNWEEPRTLESGVGTTINGYNFREDLLRMSGNGVVEQTAELAFIDLLRKHGRQPHPPNRNINYGSKRPSLSRQKI